RYMAAVARMERTGVPIDTETLDCFCRHWDRIKGRLIREVDRDYGVYVRSNRRPLDPTTRFGEAVVEAARAWDIDPDTLAEAAEHVHQTNVEVSADRLQAIRAARQATGLTTARIERLLAEGKDHADVPGLDVQARELAGMYPDMGIGIGYDPHGVDED